MAKKIHSMIRVIDEARAVQFYDTAFGLKIADRLDFPDFTLVYLSNSETEFELELTINKGTTEAYDLATDMAIWLFQSTIWMPNMPVLRRQALIPEIL